MIPALRQASADARGLLERLDALGSDTRRILLYVCNQFERAASDVNVDVRTLVPTIGLYCSHVLARLSLEEDELFPAARHLLSTEAWFQIAARCLSETKRRPPADRAVSPLAVHKRGSLARTRQIH